MPKTAKVRKAAKESAVPSTIDAIRAEAAKRTPDPKRFEKAKRRTDAAVKADSFEWNRTSSTVDGLGIHYFRLKGESVTGILCPEERELWKGFTYKFACERLDVPLRPPEIFDPPQLIRLPGNRLLAKAIADADCKYMRVKITYLGKRFKTSRHYEKVYSVESAPESHDIGRKGRDLLAKAAADAKKASGK
jgi:hypothetical protein